MPESSRASFHDWLQGARPHTWANAFAPVVAGTGAAAWSGNASIYRAMLAMVVAWALIVGVNYANDYSDGIRGTDDDRQGRSGLPAQGWPSRNTSSTRLLGRLRWHLWLGRS